MLIVRGVITALEVRTFINNSDISCVTKSKDWVVKQIETNDKSFTTATRNSEGKWSHGEDVTVITSSNGYKYLRTDANNTTKDNLDNLPDF